MDANADAIEAWNTVLFDKFTRFRHVIVTGLKLHGDAVLDRHPPHVGARVLDVGCGVGDSTQQIAALVGPKGEAVGVDAAARFIEGAKKESTCANARYFAADVQTEDLGGPYDFAFSRFGTMFFASPVAALRNVRKSLAKNAKLAMVVWRKRDENPWLFVAQQIARKFIPEEAETHDQPTCGPGPFSMAGPDMVSDQILRAGFTNVTFERYDVPILIGRTMDEAIEFALALGPAGEIVRLAKEEGVKKKPQIVSALWEAFREFETPNGIIAPSSAWIITARA